MGAIFSNQKAYWSTIIGLFFALIIHVLFLYIFNYYSVSYLVYFNVISIIVFLISIYIVMRYKLIDTVMIVGSIEVILHQTLAISLFGLDYGFQYFLLITPVFIMLGNFKKLKIPLLISALSIISLIIVTLYSYLNEPLYVMLEVQPYLHLVNLIGSTFILALFSGIYSYNTLRIENSLKKSKDELEELANKQNNLLSLFDKGDSVLFQWKNNEIWDVEYVSENVENILGYSTDDFYSGRVHYGALIDSDDIEQVMKEVEDAIDNNVDFFKHKPYRLKTKDGNEKWILDNTVTKKNEQGEITHFIGYLMDITTQKHFEKDLIKGRKLLSEAQRITKVGSWSLDNIANNLTWSDEIFEIFNIDKNEFEPSYEGFLNVIHPDDREIVNKAFSQSVESHTPYNVEHRLLMKDGSIKYVVERGETIYDEQNNPIMTQGTVQDITELKKTQEALIQAKEFAEEATKAKSEFLANMSHEIRTPMTGILGFVSQLAKGEKDQERLKHFNIIQNSGKTLLSIINDILDLSKIESGKMDIEQHPYHIHELLNTTLSVFKDIADEKSIKFETNIDETLPKCILIDDVRLKQVILNLLNNAVKFTPKNGQISLKAQYNQSKAILRISVIDTGIGIAKENLEKIFEAFAQEDSTTTRRFGGTGLGLAISSKLVQLMDGKITLESTLGKGSKFSFEIPVIKCEEDTETTETIDKFKATYIGKLEGNILIVEDNKTNQMLLGIILDDLGLSYDVANDGVESINCIQNTKYDAILMDENMPNMNGIEATKRIRSIEKEQSLSRIPIIAVTANALSSDRERFIESGMDDYVSKPYTEEDIKEVLEKFL